MTIRTVGIDLGKTVFHVIGLDEAGRIISKKRFSRPQLIAYIAKLPKCLIGMEACCGSHLIARLLLKYDHDVRLIPAQFVKPFVKSNKNDFVDAEAIAEAVQRPTMRFVPVKTEDQLDLQALHRVRDRLISRRTGVINQLRAFLLDRGLTFRTGRVYLLNHMPMILEETKTALSERMISILRSLWKEWQELEKRLEKLRGEIDGLAKQDASCHRLLDVPGVGTLVATAMVASIGNGSPRMKWH